MARARWGVQWAAATAIGLFLGIVGPFGTFFNGPAWQRLGYWMATGWLGMLGFQLCRPLFLSGAATVRRTAAGLAAMTLLIAAVLGLVSWFAARAVWPWLWRVPELTPAVWFLQSLTIAAPEVVLFAWIGRPRALHSGTEALPPAAARAGLLGARPSEVLCLQMEDHYVRVHTAAGSRLVLATMSQATSALGGAAGLRVHRSWWVADRAVVRAIEDGRRVKLMLANGLKAPVARSAVAAVRAKGWLARQAGAAA